MTGRNMRSPLPRSCPQDPHKRQCPVSVFPPVIPSSLLTVMPSGRVTKTRSHPKSSLRDILASRIENEGVDIMPCSRCRRLNLRCRMLSKQSSKCGQCAQLSLKCDNGGIAAFCGWSLFSLFSCADSTVSRNLSEQRRLEENERQAEEDLEVAMARLARIRKQKRSLRERGDALFEEGMSSLEDLEDPALAESNAVFDAQSLGAVGVIDWNSILPDDAATQCVSSEGPASGENAVSTVGNSSGA